MSLPQELLKPIDEIKTPSNKVLIISLMLALTFVVGLYIKQVAGNNRSSKEEIERLNNLVEYKDKIIDSMKQQAYRASEEDRIRLTRRVEVFDSIIKLGKQINK